MSTWEAVARQTYICMAKDHNNCDQTVCTPDNYPLHWMDEAEIALLLRLADHLNGKHEDGIKRPKTGPDAEEPKPDSGEGADKSEPADDADTPAEDAGDDAGPGEDGADGSPAADGRPVDAAGGGGSPKEGPSPSGTPSPSDTLAKAAAKAQADLKKLADLMRDAEPKGEASPNPTGDGIGSSDSYLTPKVTKQDKVYIDHHATVQRVVERNPISGRDRTMYEGVCSCGWTTSPHNFRSIGGANAAVGDHARNSKGRHLSGGEK